LASRVADIYLKDLERPAAAVLQVDPQPFTGQYRNPESHSVVDLSVAEGDLASAGEHFKALGPRRFSAASEEELTFEFNGDKPVALTLTAPDTVPQRFEKFQPFKPSAADLAQYAGLYTSSELPVPYRFALQDGHLTLGVHWRKPTLLVPSVRDEFQDPSLGTSVVFHRNVAGRIDGCDIFSRQVRHIAFAKATPSTR
jgi:hypothetical protein